MFAMLTVSATPESFTLHVVVFAQRRPGGKSGAFPRAVSIGNYS